MFKQFCTDYWVDKITIGTKRFVSVIENVLAWPATLVAPITQFLTNLDQEKFHN